MQKRWRMQKRKNTRRMKSGKKRRRVQRMERRKRLKKAMRFQRRKRIRRKRVMSRTGLYVMADNYCFLKIDESLNSINVHLPHQLTAYTDQFLLSLAYPYPYPPHLTPLSSSSSRRLSRLGLINLSIISRPLPAEEERARRR